MDSEQKQQLVRWMVPATILLLSIHGGAQAFAPGRQTHHVTKRGGANDPSSKKFCSSHLWDKANGIDPYTDNKVVSLQSKDEMKFHDAIPRARKSTDPSPSLVLAARCMVDQFKDVKKNLAAFAAISAFAVALTMTPLPSEAAMSGGRMGGSHSTSRSSSRSSYAGHSGRYGGRGYSRTLGTGFAADYGAGVFSRPSYYSPGYVVGVSQGPDISTVLFLSFWVGGVLGLRVLHGEEGGFGSSWLGQTSVLGSGTSVVKLTIAMEVPDRDDRNSILSVLDRFAKTAKTNSKVGIQNLTSEGLLNVGAMIC